ncbi:hypothetical protein GGTG_10857 [Gaeumannomyces tritici R3-111a-1]|uniref:Uncharacterized protein n=1 Tax=Gaeumannomyces tritici (strain R3-111a-1) TaxID=644352 RepID=J3PBI5_GAET3|nr:hypothetical protein GGTG_10857 [Gaeumannomyces tritici R3-111a-1]EJT71602.1 hypothetical protein GGTG_10857 [Gaeumannomyces tritici R3-111a-1]
MHRHGRRGRRKDWQETRPLPGASEATRVSSSIVSRETKSGPDTASLLIATVEPSTIASRPTGRASETRDDPSAALCAAPAASLKLPAATTRPPSGAARPLQNGRRQGDNSLIRSSYP